MQAMIFAAGKGERMLPLTQDVPKPLLKINNKMLIEYHLEKLALVGVRKIVVNVAWMAEKIMQALGNGKRYGLEIQYSIESKPLETAGAILHARNLLGNEPLLLINADVFTDFDFADLLTINLDERTWAYLVMVANPEHNPEGDYALAENGLVQTKNSERENFTFAGLSLLNPQMVYDFPETRKVFPLRDVFAWALSQNKIQGYKYSGLWSDVGTPDRLKALQNT